MRIPRGRTYKEITYQQLRSFCETARLGSFTAAARALGLTHPTVWMQVHALERDLGEKLVERFGRGCRLTPAGELLVELSGPAVAGITTLKRTFQESRSQVPPRLVVGAFPRFAVEDLPKCVEAFVRRQPHVQLTLLEIYDNVTRLVEEGEVDLAFAEDADLPTPSAESKTARLCWEPCYEVDIFLVTPRDHPLARRRHIRIRDLRAYPLVNALDSHHDRVLRARLERYGFFADKRRRIVTRSAAAVRRYVEMGFGIGLVTGLPAHTTHRLLHERNLSHLFGRSVVYLVWRNGAALSSAGRLFVDTVKTQLNPDKKRRGRDDP